MPPDPGHFITGASAHFEQTVSAWRQKAVERQSNDTGWNFAGTIQVCPGMQNQSAILLALENFISGLIAFLPKGRPGGPDRVRRRQRSFT